MAISSVPTVIGVVGPPVSTSNVPTAVSIEERVQLRLEHPVGNTEEV